MHKNSTHFGLEVSAVCVISSLYPLNNITFISRFYVLNCFKYFGAKCFKNQTRKLYQVVFSMLKWLDTHKYFWTISILCSKMFQYFHIIYIKRLISKNRFYFFSSYDMQKFHHLLRCHDIGINSTAIYFLNALRLLEFTMQSQKSDKNIRIIFTKIIV